MSKKSAGDRLDRGISATDWNSMVDVAHDYKTRRRLSLPVDLSPQLLAGTTVKAQNNSGSDLDAGSVLELGAAIIDTLDLEHFWFEGNEPAGEGLPFGICRRELKVDQIGELQVIGVTLATVDLQNATDKFASPVDGSTVLESNEGGPVQIIHRPTDTGEQTCAVLLPSSARRERYAAYVGGTAITARSGSTLGSGTVTLKKKSGTSVVDHADSDNVDITKTVYNLYGGASGTNVYVFVEQDSLGVWWLVNEDCS